MKKNIILKRVAELIINHIKINKKSYAIIFLIFLIGLLIGVVVVNNMSNESIGLKEEYINTCVYKINEQNLNSMEILKLSLKNNVIYACIIWFFGTTVIGIPIVFAMILYKGFSLGYVISLVSAVLGVKNSMIFSLLGLAIHNMMLLPVIFAIAVSGMKLYKSIIIRKKIVNIKQEIFRHIFFSSIMLIGVIFASMLESFVSSILLKIMVGYL